MTQRAPHRDHRGSTLVHVLVLPHVHMMDLSGPVQVLYEANGFGASYELRFCSPQPRARSAQGIWLAELQPLAPPSPDDLVLVPGISSACLGPIDVRVASWLRNARSAGARVCSICSAAFVLAEAGILDGLQCTTHWKIAERMRRDYPAVRVLENRLFVRDGGVITSAGVASGIDTALAIVEQDQGPLLAAKVAREMVVYMRRDGSSTQRSVYLDYRTHIHPSIHQVQDLLIHRIDESPTIDELAHMVGMSPRNLTRVFRQATGISLKRFSHELKLEIARNLLRDPTRGLDAVATSCGFKDARQLRRLWQQRFGMSPSAWRAHQERRSA
jgi:transcriptional regulator GlxA family with amidase domain